MEMADSSPECGGTYNLRARMRKYFENDSDSSPIQCGQRNTKSSSEGHYTLIKLTCLSISYMRFVKSTHLMIKMRTYLYIFMIYVLNIGTITFYYIANLTCIAIWPKYTIFGWRCHMELSISLLHQLSYSSISLYFNK